VHKSFLTADLSKKKSTPNFLEIPGNIFDEKFNVYLVVCVVADFKMTQGIALAVRRKIGNITQLRNLNKSVTEFASLDTENISVFYLITREHSLLSIGKSLSTKMCYKISRKHARNDKLHIWHARV